MGSYRNALQDKTSDIQQHLGLLHGLACLVNSVVEIGVRSGHSTAALCASGKPVTSYDISPCEPHATRLRNEYKNWTFIVGNSMKVVIPKCDLLFIDGEHTYRTLFTELMKHGERVTTWIALHDTETFAMVSKDKSKPGLREAILDFTERYPEWVIVFELPNNNGLTLLERNRLP